MSSRPADPKSATPPAPCGATVTLRDWGWRHAGRKAWALRHISFTLAPGERVLVLGASGAGKSTLLAGLAGLLGGEDEGEAEGTLTIDGQRPETVRGRVGMVMQDPEAQIVLARTGDDVAFGCENLGVPRAEIWRRVDASLDAVGLDFPLDHPTNESSGGQKQRLALASVLAMQPGLLLLDEPTANLDPSGVAEVHHATRAILERSEATMVVIEHRVDVWADIVDRVLVILDGTLYADGPFDEVLAEHGDALRAAGIWLPGDSHAVVREVGAARTRSGGEPEQDANLGSDVRSGVAVGADAGSRITDTPTVLSARNLTIGYSAAHPIRQAIDLDIAEGTSTCIIGSNGLGKTTLALTLAGLLDPISGEVSVAQSIAPGKDLNPAHWSSHELLGRVSMVFQEPEYQFLERTVRAELEVGPRKTGVEGAELDALVTEHLELLDLTDLALAHPMTLSGGEKRRLSVATALTSAPKILIVDEPTFGQDRRSWIELVRLLRRAVSKGTTLISITHDASFIEAMGDRIIDLADVGEAPVSNVLVPSGRAPKGANTSTEVGANAESVGTRAAAGANAREQSGAGGNAEGQGNARATTGQTGTHTTSDTGRRLQGGTTLGRTEVSRPRRGLLGTVNPVFQVLGVAVMTTPLIVSIDVVSAGVALLVEMMLVPLVGVRYRKLLVRMIPVFFAAPLGALSMLLYANPGGSVYWSFGPAVISDRSIHLALGIFVRIFALALPAVAVLPRIDPTDMADGLTQILRLPARPVLASLAAVRMTGLMVDDWRGLQRARRIRGVGEGNRVALALRGSFALLVFALRRSAKLSLTMEARGFGSDIPRTHARVSTVGVADAIMMAVSVAVPTAALVAAMWVGTFELLGR
ncbi:MAG: cobalt ABC transporter [Actinobacteria bacterium]|nr:MAG: cobalt ABC transporter [Actinomycetota bacterium]